MTQDRMQLSELLEKVGADGVDVTVARPLQQMLAMLSVHDMGSPATVSTTRELGRQQYGCHQATLACTETS